MSEIVASVYVYMEQTGYREGILFLDEINCVSETLAPVMLQLLRLKNLERIRCRKAGYCGSRESAGTESCSA